MVHVAGKHTWPYQGPTLETIFEPPLVRPMPILRWDGGNLRLTLMSPIVNPSGPPIKATDPKELLMVLAPSVESSKGNYKEFES